MMYQMRFPDEDVSALTVQQLRGREGARIRAVYSKFSRQFGVAWSGREYDSDDFESGSPVNKALSAAHACLYGLCHSVIAAMGLSPGLGFVHTGHERSFVYDIADLYKAEITIPAAFEIAAKAPDDIGGEVRRTVRDRLASGNILERCTKDIRRLLTENDADDSEQDAGVDVLRLWDDKAGEVASGIMYYPHREGTGDCEEDEEDVYGYGNIISEDKF
jgi:CRISPR-associated protein Cas1